MELLIINWGNTLIIVGFGFGMVLTILSILVLLLVLWEKSPLLFEQIRKPVKSSGQESTEDPFATNDGEIAAITAAIHLYFNEIHDIESNIVTIKRIERSSWNSKINGMKNTNWEIKR